MVICMVIYIYIYQARNSTAKCGSVFRSVAATMLESFPNSGLVSHEPSSYWMLLGYPILTSTHLNNLNRTQHCCHKYSQVASESCEFGSRQSFSIAETLEQYHGSLAVQQWYLYCTVQQMSKLGQFTGNVVSPISESFSLGMAYIRTLSYIYIPCLVNFGMVHCWVYMGSPHCPGFLCNLRQWGRPVAYLCAQRLPILKAPYVSQDAVTETNHFQLSPEINPPTYGYDSKWLYIYNPQIRMDPFADPAFDPMSWVPTAFTGSPERSFMLLASCDRSAIWITYPTQQISPFFDPFACGCSAKHWRALHLPTALQLRLCQSVCKLFCCWPHLAASSRLNLSLHLPGAQGKSQPIAIFVGNASWSHRPKKLKDHPEAWAGPFVLSSQQSVAGRPMVRSCLVFL